MSDHTPNNSDDRLSRILGEPEPGDDALMADPAMRRVLDAFDSIDPDDRFDTPPASLWDAIAAEVGSSSAEAASDGIGDSGRGGSTGPRHAGDAEVVPLRRGGPPWWMGAAAAILVVLVVAVGALAIATGTDPDQELAAADLDLLLDDADATGAATLIRTADTDELVLMVDVEGLGEIDGYYEVWLLTPAVDGLVSLGPLRTDGRYQLPPGLDPNEFSVVDISIEPHDGDPNHSGNSILRGGLQEA